ncbi:MAG: alginate export family protein, partial [Acidobacteriota bacterium]
MNVHRFHSALCALIVVATSPGLLAQTDPAKEAESFTEALKKGEAKITLRYRFEDVRQDGFAKDAHASTLRTTVGYTTQPYKGFSLKIEAENVAEIGNDLYNNRGAGSDFNGVTDRPVVADPALTDINQVFLRYQHDKTDLRLGRQEIVQDDSRFIGNVGWRQHHQS